MGTGDHLRLSYNYGMHICGTWENDLVLHNIEFS